MQVQEVKLVLGERESRGGQTQAQDSKDTGDLGSKDTRAEELYRVLGMIESS